MSNTNDVDFGPLEALIGVWTGEEGMDIAPDPHDEETNSYFETITCSPLRGVTNAERQNLAAVHYCQIVQRKSDGEVIHHETGYYMLDADTRGVMHSLVIPRAVCVLAGGTYSGKTDPHGRVVIEVSAGIDDENWKIIQSPFMAENATTTAFNQEIIVGNGRLSYAETTTVKIYDKTFKHTDKNNLILTKGSFP